MQRNNQEMRANNIILDVNSNAPGSLIYCSGKTKILATMSIADQIPKFLKDNHTGWLSAEYSMLPSSTESRTEREYKRPHSNGRSMEIQRLIARSLRSTVDLKKLLHRKTIVIDCDVIQADGSTRTNSINAGMIALIRGLQVMQYKQQLFDDPILHLVAAVSIGKIGDEFFVDMDYNQDSNAEYDMNIVMNNHGDLIEIQGTSEKKTIARNEINIILDLAWKEIEKIFEIMKKTGGLN